MAKKVIQKKNINWQVILSDLSKHWSSLLLGVVDDRSTHMIITERYTNGDGPIYEIVLGSDIMPEGDEIPSFETYEDAARFLANRMQQVIYERADFILNKYLSPDNKDFQLSPNDIKIIKRFKQEYAPEKRKKL
jgi:hypothetical protein